MTATPIVNKEILQHLWRLTPAHMAEKLTNGKFKRYAHIEFLSQYIARSIAQGSGRIVISVPPRHGNSWLTSLWTPTWFLSLNPDQNAILTSYEGDFAATWGRQVRNLITEHGASLWHFADRRFEGRRSLEYSSRRRNGYGRRWWPDYGSRRSFDNRR